jgi:hypothetical protein
MKGTVLYDMTPCSLVKFTDASDEVTSYTFRAGECPVCISHHEDRINRLVRNVDKFPPEYTASHTARQKIHNAHWKTEEKGKLGRPRLRGEDNIKIDLQEMGCGSMV